MIYLYKCTDKDCHKTNEAIEINKPMSEASREEKCHNCHNTLKRVYTASSIKTAGDGVKL